MITCWIIAMESIQHTHRETMQQLQELLDAKEQSKSSDDTTLPSVKVPNTRQEEQEEMHRITEQLYDENATLRQQIMEKDNELQECKKKLLSLPASTTSSQEQSQPTPQNQSISNKEQDEADGIDVYGELFCNEHAKCTDDDIATASMSHLLSPLVGGSENKVDLEKKVQHLSIMLQESEDRVSALRAQEKVMQRNYHLY